MPLEWLRTSDKRRPVEYWPHELKPAWLNARENTRVRSQASKHLANILSSVESGALTQEMGAGTRRSG